MLNWWNWEPINIAFSYDWVAKLSYHFDAAKPLMSCQTGW